MPENTQLYYIQDTRQIVGNCMLWWGPNRAGYTTQLEEAGLYPKKEAEEICRNRRTDRAWPKDLVESNTVTHVRAGRLVTAAQNNGVSMFRCKRCKAMPGMPCTTPSGAIKDTLHSRRTVYGRGQ